MKSENTSVIHLLHRAGQVADNAFGKSAADLTPRQFAVLEAIDRLGGGHNQHALVEKTGIDRSTLADIIRRLIRLKLVTRVTSKVDGRCKLVNLTYAGNDAIMAGRVAAKEADETILSKISPSQQKVLVKALQAIGEAA